jgi:hypothetical protein
MNQKIRLQSLGLTATRYVFTVWRWELVAAQHALDFDDSAVDFFFEEGETDVFALLEGECFRVF